MEWSEAVASIRTRVQCIACAGARYEAPRRKRDEAVADARQMAQILWALPGNTNYRRNSDEVVVRCIGGDPRMVNEILANRAARDTLTREETSHPAHIFGETVEAENSAAGDRRHTSLKRRREDADIAKNEADKNASLEE